MKRAVRKQLHYYELKYDTGQQLYSIYDLSWAYKFKTNQLGATIFNVEVIMHVSQYRKGNTLLYTCIDHTIYCYGNYLLCHLY